LVKDAFVVRLQKSLQQQPIKCEYYAHNIKKSEPSKNQKLTLDAVRVTVIFLFRRRHAESHSFRGGFRSVAVERSSTDRRLFVLGRNGARAAGSGPIHEADRGMLLGRSLKRHGLWDAAAGTALAYAC